LLKYKKNRIGAAFFTRSTQKVDLNQQDDNYYLKKVSTPRHFNRQTRPQYRRHPISAKVAGLLRLQRYAAWRSFKAHPLAMGFFFFDRSLCVKPQTTGSRNHGQPA
jgi:hypothetical protein